MKIVGIFPRESQVGFIVDSLKNIGLSRKDMIISDIEKTPYRNSTMDNVYIKTETESLQNLSTLAEEYQGEFENGIIVSVEVPKKKANAVREIMEQNGAVKIYDK